jgi:O-acetyl-ADP-ribose deacetylase (regulator of RNase III)
MTNNEMLDRLLQALMAENRAIPKAPIPEDEAGKRTLLRGLMNLRPPLPIRPELLELQDRLLLAERELKGVTDPFNLPTVQGEFGNSSLPFADQLVLWKGDITLLAADAIVNAANSKLLGCFIPHHRCIDNAIHSAAGIQLRLECNAIMQKQGFDEPTGQAKITRGYNLPARFVLHTVGPVIGGAVSEQDQRRLASCYTTCLDLASQTGGIKFVAFCCISTGEFRFPKALAAQIAIRTVCERLKGAQGQLERVIFNVFTQEDYDVYAAIFSKN